MYYIAARECECDTPTCCAPKIPRKKPPHQISRPRGGASHKSRTKFVGRIPSSFPQISREICGKNPLATATSSFPQISREICGKDFLAKSRRREVALPTNLARDLWEEPPRVIPTNFAPASVSLPQISRDICGKHLFAKSHYHSRAEL